MGLHPPLQQRATAVLGARRPGLAGRPRVTRRATARQTGAQAEALEKLSAALEATDPYTHGHSRRVARHCWMIAKRMGLDSETVDRVRTAASLHDVGKVYTPPEVLRKPGRLTDEEFDVIKRHPVDGAELVKALGDDELISIVRHHHERLDGTGYPDRLVGEQIPIGARIISVADTFDAITSARPYRPARAHKKALDILKYEAGTQLDPGVVKAFCAIYSGRRPLALWASFTSLPSQVFSWLGAGAATAASAAQVAAVAAAAAVGVTAAMTPHHHRSGRHSRSAGQVQLAEVASHPLAGASYGYVVATRRTHRPSSKHSLSAAVARRIQARPCRNGDHLSRRTDRGPQHNRRAVRLPGREPRSRVRWWRRYHPSATKAPRRRAKRPVPEISPPRK